MKVLILTEGGKNIGYGHVTRCLALYDAFEEAHIKPDIVVHGDDSVMGMLKCKRYSILDWSREKAKVFKVAREMDIVIVDSYLAGHNFYVTLSGMVKLPVYIDDNMRIDYPCGVVMNGTAYAEKIEYPKINKIHYLLGSRYALLRKEFFDVPRKRIRKNVKSVLVTFGGCDPRNVTPKVLNLLSREYPHLNKNVVVGRGFKHANELKTYGDKNTIFINDPTADFIKELMAISDIAISAGGQTVYELARMGVPSIVITVAENQVRNSMFLSRAGVIDHVGYYTDDERGNDKIMMKLKTDVDHVIHDRVMRLERYLNGKKIVDGRGARRAVKEIVLYMECNK